jgi:hypothetical protein
VEVHLGLDRVGVRGAHPGQSVYSLNQTIYLKSAFENSPLQWTQALCAAVCSR